MSAGPRRARDGNPPRPVLLFVHAHPDDETLATGVSLAHHAAAGHDVHLLTCTLGEEGEVIPPELAHLAAGREDRLGPWRREELRKAMAVLGVRSQVLGETPGRSSRYRDSGMAGSPGAEHPDAFVRARPDEAAALVRAVLVSVRPQVVVTYDRYGGYGHPDHVQAHRTTCAAVASLPEGERPLLYAVLTPKGWAEQDRAWLAANVSPECGWHVPAADEAYPPSVVPDDLVTHEIVDPAAAARQAQALRAHRTQVVVRAGCYALSNLVAARLPAREGFAVLDPFTGLPVPSAEPGTRHTGLLLEDET